MIHHPTGSTSLGGDFSFDDGSPFVFLVSGVDRSPRYDMQSLRWSRSLSKPSRVGLTFWDKTKTWHPTVGEPVELHLGAELVFRGSLEEVSEEQLLSWNSQANRIALNCVDSERLASRYVVAKNYEVVDQTMRDVILDVVDVQTPMGTDDLVSLLMEDTGPDIAPFLVDYQTVKDVLNLITRQTGHCWYFTASGDLVVEALGKTMAPFEVSDANAVYDNVKVVTSRAKLRNRQFLRAGAQKTTGQEDKFLGDGQTQTFPLRFAVDNDPEITKPTFSINDVPVSSALVGIQGAEDDAMLEWLYNVGGKTVSQTASLTALTSSQTLKVEYTGQVPTIILEELQTSIDDRLAVEGGSGLYEHIEQDEDLVDRQFALERAEGFLNRFGTPTETLSFSTRETGLQPGQLLTVNLADQGIQKDFLVQTVTLRDRGGTVSNGNLWWSVVAASPPEELESWVEFFTRNFRGKQVTISRTNEKVLIVRKREEQIAIDDDVQVDDGLTAPVSDPIGFDAFSAAVLGVTTSTFEDSMLIGSAITPRADRYFA